MVKTFGIFFQVDIRNCYFYKVCTGFLDTSTKLVSSTPVQEDNDKANKGYFNKVNNLDSCVSMDVNDFIHVYPSPINSNPTSLLEDHVHLEDRKVANCFNVFNNNDVHPGRNTTEI